MIWYDLLYSTAIVISAIVTLLLLLVSWRYRRLPHGRAVLPLFLIGAVQTFAFAVLIFSRSPATAHLWYHMYLSGAALLPVLWFLLVLHFVGHHRSRLRRYRRWFFFFPVLTILLLWTDKTHSLLWHIVQYSQRSIFMLPDNSTAAYGPWLVLQNAYNYTLIIGGGVILVYAAFHTHQAFKKQTVIVLLGTLILFVANIPDTYALTPFVFTPIGIALGGLVIGWGVFGFQFRNLIPAARYALVDSLMDGVIVLNLEKYIVDLNPVAQRLLNVHPGEVIGHSAAEILKFWPLLEEHLPDNEQVRTEFDLKQQDELRHYEIRCLPFKISDEWLNGWLVILHDITGEKQRQRDLEEYARRMDTVADEIVHLLDEERRQRQMAESLRQVAIIINSSLDLQTVLSKILEQLRQVIQHNGAAIFLLEGEELVLTAGDMIPESYFGKRISLHSDTPVARAFKQRALLTLDDVSQDPAWETWSDETPIRGWIAAPLFVEDRPIGVISADSFEVGGFTPEDGRIMQTFADHAAIAIRNARQVEQTNESLREARLLYRIGSILAQTPDMQQAIERALGEFLQGLNVKQGGITLFDPERRYGELYALYMDGRPQPIGKQIIISEAHQHIIKTGQPLAIYDAYNDPLMLDTRDLTIAHNIKSILLTPLIARGEVIGLLGADTTREYHRFTDREVKLAQAVAGQIATAVENARLFEREQQARAAAEAANRAKSIFLASMSHELRTPLNAIIGFSELLARDANLAADQLETLSIIHQNGKHLLHLINDILDMAKIEAGQVQLQKQDFDLRRLLTGLEKMFRIKASEKGLTFIYEEVTGIPRYIRTDPKRLRQVLINLLDNAIKFTNQGHVTLRVSCTPQESSSLDDNSVQIHFEVEDTGPGIAPDEIATIFEPFVQTQLGQQVSGGTGLGLSISRQFVELMGGTLTVVSAVGQGARFQFDIQAELVKVDLAPEAESAPVFSTASLDNLAELAQQCDLPSDWLAEMRQATLQADIELITNLINQIHPQYPELATSLTILAHNFDYEAIRALLKTEETEAQAL